MLYKKLLVCLSVFCAGMVMAGDALSVVAQKKQSAIQRGTTVRAKMDATGLYDQECYDAYYSCMDQFCITDNSNGGTCTCSDDSIEYEKQFAQIQDMMAEAERIKTIEVEKVKAGANADIIFTGQRKYDENGNLISLDELQGKSDKEKQREEILAVFNTSIFDEEEDIFGAGQSYISDLQGDALFFAADEMCRNQIPEKCASDVAFLSQMYSKQIVSDCKAFENTISTKRTEAQLALADAEAAVRTALQESFDSANKLDLGQCMVEFRKCMLTEDACGKDWKNCVSVVAAENMQNNKAESTAGTTVATVDKYDFTASTMELLNAKRPVCENVLSQCVAVRDQVWPAFLRENAPTIKVAETIVESQMRQSCLTDISDCIQTACKDDIAGKGVATMDACLSRPDMARSFCKVEIDRCERMEPLIWGYVVDKLAAMRVDACTQEVKDCFTADTRCGPNFENCIGMDYEYIHDMCPIDTLVVCKANNPKFSMDDLDSMLMGLYLNIDNAALENCQNIVDRKMAEVCGSTVDCNRFAADDTMGAGSVRSQKDGDIYRVTGMISFGSIKMGDASGSVYDIVDGKEVKLAPGEIGVQGYLETIKQRNANVPEKDSIIATIEEELNNIAGNINRTIQMIEQDPEIQYCVNGRDLSQITGKAGQKTTARFPNLLNQIKMQIAISALRQAQDNYNEKLNTAIADATKNASADIAQYMCQKIAQANNGGFAENSLAVTQDLAEPYAISYEVGTGLTNEELKLGGAGVVTAGGAKFTNSRYLGGSTLDGAGSSKETTAIFNRDTRICHVCTVITTSSCKTTGSTSWFHNSRNASCETTVASEKCEDIQM